MHCRPSSFTAFRVLLTSCRVKPNVNFKEDRHSVRNTVPFSVAMATELDKIAGMLYEKDVRDRRFEAMRVSLY